MPAFSPEISARALMPKDLLSQASLLHLALHVNERFIDAAVAEASGSEMYWNNHFDFGSESLTADHISNFLKERNWGTKVFRKCSISFDTEKFCLVPSAFFTQEKSMEILEFSTGKVYNEHAYIEIPEMDAYMIYECPSWMNEVSKIFPNAKFIPSAYLFLKNSANHSVFGKDVLQVFHTPGFMMIIAFSGKKFLLLNSFPVRNEEDILYYASNTALRLNIDFENAPLILLDASADEACRNLLRQYNRGVQRLFEPEDENPTSFISHLHILCA